MPPSARLVLLCGAGCRAGRSPRCSAHLPPGRSSRGLDDARLRHVVRAGATRPPDGRVVIVDVDERSLSASANGRGGATWSAADRRAARRWAPRRSRSTSSSPNRSLRGGAGPDADAALAGDAARADGVVLGYALTFEPARATAAACVLHPLGLAIVQPRRRAADEPFFRATGAVCNLPLLDAGRRRVRLPERRARSRRHPAARAAARSSSTAASIPALALAAVRAATGVHETSRCASPTSTRRR